MREEDRRRQRRRLDEELQPFRRAGRDKRPTNGLLRAVRRALGVPVAEIGAKLGVTKSVVFASETGELSGTIQMNTLSRAAEALGCKVVYGLVPMHGQTLEALAAELFVKRVMKDRGQGSEIRDQERACGSPGSAVGDDELGRSEGSRNEGLGEVGTGTDQEEEVEAGSESVPQGLKPIT
jgi:predicted DNA-binding mobile mystery protein A